MAAILKREYDLDIDIDQVFDVHGGKDLKMSDFEHLLLAK